MGSNVWWDDVPGRSAAPDLLLAIAIAAVVAAAFHLLSRSSGATISLAYLLALTPAIGVAFLLLFNGTGSFMIAGGIVIVAGLAGAVRLSR